MSLATADATDLDHCFGEDALIEADRLVAGSSSHEEAVRWRRARHRLVWHRLAERQESAQA